MVIGDEDAGGLGLVCGGHGRGVSVFGLGDSDTDDGALVGVGEDLEVATGVKGTGFHGAEADTGFGVVFGVEADSVVGNLEGDSVGAGLELEGDGFGVGVADGVTEGFACERGELDALVIIEE